MTCNGNSNSGLDGPMSSVTPEKSCLKLQLAQKCNRKRVQLASHPQQHTHIHKNDYSPEEKKACFLTRTEILVMTSEINHTLRHMRVGRLPNTGDMYFRGLEIELPVPKKQCGERRALAMNAIQEYETEHQTQYLDEEWVNTVYRKITVTSVKLGLKAANYDQVQAEQVYKTSLRSSRENGQYMKK
jgi:hypothetical protein